MIVADPYGSFPGIEADIVVSTHKDHDHNDPEFYSLTGARIAEMGDIPRTRLTVARLAAMGTVDGARVITPAPLP